jgi:hypothetical protein
MWSPPAITSEERSTTPLNASATSRWQPTSSSEDAAYRSDMRPTARPETHQNLIYPDKDHSVHKTLHRDLAPRGKIELLLLCDDLDQQGQGRCPWTPAKAEPLQSTCLSIGVQGRPGPHA